MTEFKNFMFCLEEKDLPFLEKLLECSKKGGLYIHDLAMQIEHFKRPKNNAFSKGKIIFYIAKVNNATMIQIPSYNTGLVRKGWNKYTTTELKEESKRYDFLEDQGEILKRLGYLTPLELIVKEIKEELRLDNDIY